jgi:hypothetical protein
MAPNNYHNLERDEQQEETARTTQTCLPLALVKTSLECLSRCWRSEQGRNRISDPFEKKYVHKPTHAASSFLRTATTRDIQRANEVL